MTHVQAMAQKTPYKVIKDTTDGQTIFNGRISFEDLGREASFTWLSKGRDEYQPDAKAMKLLQFYLRQYTVVVFLGTWCDDSHNLIPKFEKVMDLLKYPNDMLTMYGVDRDKLTTGGEQKQYSIRNVPTIILFKDSNEAGRITETIKVSVEADMAAIIEADMAGQQPR
jgi:thiol-disulfide isomerase/thioredoxin